MTQLAAGVLKELLSSTGVAPEEVNDVILGQVGHKILIPPVDNEKLMMNISLNCDQPMWHVLGGISVISGII